MSRKVVVLLMGAAMAVAVIATAGMALAQEIGEPPSDPSGLVATAASNSRIDLTWADNATNETAYAVERSLDGSGGWVDLTSTLPADTTIYSDTGLSADTAYHYRVKATNATGSSGYSNTAGTKTHALAPASPTLNPTPDSTWMTNGTVYSMIRYGDYVYVGGNFTRAMRAPGGQSFAATNLARFNANTGVGDPTWTPDVTGTDMTTTQVYALAAAGGKIWVGGKFEAVDGVARRNLAAVSPATGVLDPIVDPIIGSATSGAVRALLASSTKVYVGGGFTTFDGKSRSNLGALDFSGNVDPAWKPKASSSVRSLASSCDGATVFAGGTFRNAAGSNGVYSPRYSLARFTATDGSLHPWAIPAAVVGNDEGAIDLSVTCERITVAYQGPNYARSFRLDDGNSGTLAWANKCGGDPQAVAMLGPDKVVIGGHFSQIKRVKRVRIALVNLSDGSVVPGWSPAVEGHWMGPWDLLVDENHLFVGGRFTTVGGLTQYNFARFTFS